MPLFYEHPSQMSEIFWESMHRFLKKREHLLGVLMDEDCFTTRAAKYTSSVTERCRALGSSIGFLHGTVIGIKSPGVRSEQYAGYYGHKCKHTPKVRNAHDLGRPFATCVRSH